jgi:hypothetical protein
MVARHTVAACGFLDLVHALVVDLNTSSTKNKNQDKSAGNSKAS